MTQPMIRYVFQLAVVFCLALSGASARAFSLAGQIPAWFTDQTGLYPNGSDIYGPVNLGEEYRWNIPRIHYAFDEAFLNYFGQRGIDEVEKAVKIINDLPAVSTITNLSQFPLHAWRVNYRARDLGLTDLRSEALTVLLEQLGLGNPTRFVFTTRVRAIINNTTNYLVIMRNFDPETWTPTPYINGQLWTYNDIYDNQDSPTVKSATLTEPVDPLILAEPAAVGVPNFGFGVSTVASGFYATGLTRDDVGGLRYIYRKDNANVETLPADAVSAVGAFGGSASGSGSAGEDWNLIGYSNPKDGSTIDQWIPVPPQNLTNTVNTGGQAGAGTGGTTTTPTTTPFYTQALRAGIDKITFTRSPGIYQPNGYGATNTFSEIIRVVFTNRVERVVTQRVRRILTQPDILFTAADLAQPTASVRILSRTSGAVNNDGLNGLPGQQTAADGPGQFNPTIQIAFNKLGPAFVNIPPSFNFQPSSFTYAAWGSFDGTTNDPVIYPMGSTVRDVERTVFGSR